MPQLCHHPDLGHVNQRHISEVRIVREIFLRNPDPLASTLRILTVLSKAHGLSRLIQGGRTSNLAASSVSWDAAMTYRDGNARFHSRLQTAV